MNIAVIGSGGREHALCWKIAQSPLTKKLYSIPGNGGTKEIAENIDIDLDAISLIVRSADGSVRDGLSLLDQAITSPNEKVDSQTVISMLGLADREKIFESVLLKKLQGFYGDIGWVLNLNPHSSKFFTF